MPALNTQLLSGLLLGSGASIHGLAGTGAVITCTLFGSKAEAIGQFVQGVLAQSQLATSDSLIYQTPADNVVAVRQLWLANTSGSPVTGVAISIKGAAGTAANQIISSLTIPANGQAILSDEGIRVFDASGNVYQTAAVPFGLTGLASTVAASSAIVNAEAQVVGVTLPANFMAAGTTFKVTAAGRITTLTSPGNDVFKVRIGTVTLTGNIAATVTAAAVASITTQPFWLEFLVTVRTAGVSGTVVGQGIVSSTNVSTGAFTSLNIVGITTSAVAVDTTGPNILELTAITGATDSSVTFQNAAIELVKA